MAKKIQESKGKELKRAEWKGYVNFELNSEQKEQMRVWIRDLEVTAVELDELCASHYELKVFKNSALGCYQATCFCADPKSENAGYLLQAFAPHWFDALCCIAFKHAVILQGVWPKGHEVERDTWG